MAGNGIFFTLLKGNASDGGYKGPVRVGQIIVDTGSHKLGATREFVGSFIAP